MAQEPLVLISSSVGRDPAAGGTRRVGDVAVTIGRRARRSRPTLRVKTWRWCLMIIYSRSAYGIEGKDGLV
jgi:hypothetical protein